MTLYGHHQRGHHVRWYHSPVGSSPNDWNVVYTGDDINDRYRDRFTVQSDITGQLNLVIVDVMSADAGRYRFWTFETDNSVVTQLAVIGR